MSQTPPVQIKADVERITFRNDDNGWTVSRMRLPGFRDLVTVVGSFAHIHEGQSYELFGGWIQHPQYGAQFQTERAIPIRPSTPAAIERYLASGSVAGIGEKTAGKIVAKFGKDTLDVLDSDPERLKEVPGLGKKKIRSIIDSWNQERSVRDVMMFLSTHGISPLFAKRIFDLYGKDAITLVAEDPYRLASDIHGIGFRSADRVAESLGIAQDSEHRIRAAIVFQLQSAEDQGHCYLTTEQLLNELTTTLGLDKEVLFAKLLDALYILNERAQIQSEKIYDAELSRESQAHYRTQTLVAEATIATTLARLLEKDVEVDRLRVDAWLAKFCETTGVVLNEAQNEAVRMSARSRVFVLTGGPGVGKTTTANAIIRLFKAQGRTVALCAPTGRAAQRLSEVSGMPARTIHRLLEWNPGQGGFAFDENQPLSVQAVIVDEASMLDVHLADALLRAVPRTAQIIFIGDVDQLPSVGPGNFLRDLIHSKLVPSQRLNEIFRQAHTSRIVLAAHQINEGHFPEFDMSSDCKFIDAATADDVRTIIRKLLTEKLTKDMGFDVTRDIQILTPMHRGDLGTQTLNDEMQDLLNPAHATESFKRGSVNLRTGDKVIQTVNNYDLGVFNGDIGYVIQCAPQSGKLIVRFGERFVEYKNEQTLDLRLAYAITIHKSQGSEFPVVIIPLTMQHYVMLQRNLVYTALTRAKKLAIFLGSRKALAYAINQQLSATRQTMLIDRIKRALD